MAENIKKFDFDPIKGVCRLCLKKSAVMKPFFEDETDVTSSETTDDESIIEIIKRCAAIEIRKDDGHPQNVCQQCLTELQEFNRVRQNWLRSQTVLENENSDNAEARIIPFEEDACTRNIAVQESAHGGDASLNDLQPLEFYRTETPKEDDLNNSNNEDDVSDDYYSVRETEDKALDNSKRNKCDEEEVAKGDDVDSGINEDGVIEDGADGDGVNEGGDNEDGASGDGDNEDGASGHGANENGGSGDGSNGNGADENEADEDGDNEGGDNEDGASGDGAKGVGAVEDGAYGDGANEGGAYEDGDNDDVARFAEGAVDSSNDSLCDAETAVLGNDYEHNDFEVDGVVASISKKSTKKTGVDSRGKKPLKCQHCKKRYAEVKYWIRHIDVHSKRKRHMCFFCDKIYTNLDDLKLHLYSHNYTNF